VANRGRAAPPESHSDVCLRATHCVVLPMTLFCAEEEEDEEEGDEDLEDEEEAEEDGDEDDEAEGACG